jgi:hypothetical protein
MIKFFAWEMSFSEKVLKSREIELGKLVNGKDHRASSHPECFLSAPFN